MENNQLYEKKGYLQEAYRIFYLQENETKEIENHYHDFDKILIFISGDVRYTIEGKTYHLLPNDIVLVPHGDVHKVEIRSGISYERIVIYIEPDYLLPRQGVSFYECFAQTKEHYSNVVRGKDSKGAMYKTIEKLKKSLQETKLDAYENVYRETLLQQFLIFINREVLRENISYVDTNRYNEKIIEIIQYINEHLTEDIDIEQVAKDCYISRFHMMRQFKAETGYTIGNYISNKRLFMARELLGQGKSVTDACFQSGFHDQSTFHRAYKQLFGTTPAKSREEL